MTGEQAVQVKVTDIIMVSFELFLTVEEFFSDDAIITNLAIFFGVPNNKVRYNLNRFRSHECSLRMRWADQFKCSSPSYHFTLIMIFILALFQIRVVNVISEDSQLTQRRKRALQPGSIIVQVEIGK